MRRHLAVLWAAAAVGCMGGSMQQSDVYVSEPAGCSAACEHSTGVGECGDPQCQLRAFRIFHEDGGVDEGTFVTTASSARILSKKQLKWDPRTNNIIRARGRQVPFSKSSIGSILSGDLQAQWSMADPTIAAQMKGAQSQ